MKFFKHFTLTLLFISCNLIPENEEEEFYFYEPVISEAYKVVTDLDYMVEYEYKIQKDLLVETVDSRGYKYKLMIPAFALTPGYPTSFSGLIIPLTGIQNLPAGIDFKFGLEIEPYGMTFSKPVTITVELPGDFNTEDLMGFYSPGDWSNPLLEPIKIKRYSDKIEAIFSVIHFSSYGGMDVDEGMFECPDHRSAQACNDLKEIIACKLGHYELGFNGELNGEDKKAINEILRDYMDRQLDYLEEEPPDYFDIYQFQADLSEYLCWMALTQEFNGDYESVFGDLYERANSIIKEVLSTHADDMENACLQSREVSECVVGTEWFTIQSYIQWLEIAQKLGLDQELNMNDIYEFCDGAVNESLYIMTMINPLSMDEYYHPDGEDVWFKNYQIEFSSPDETFSFMYIMENAIGEHIQIEESDISWVEDNVAYYVEGAFIYSNGELGLNTNQQYVRESLNCNPSEDPCVEVYHSGFSVMRKDCRVAYVDITWDIR